ncbi:MAG: hypothetical protein HKM93_00175 [Desulfobacteraceae bacterium]|nr:hypothetical protein [Desulfobacteraceae bacterium]
MPKKKLWIIIVAGFFIVAGIAGGAYFMLKKSAPSTGPSGLPRMANLPMDKPSDEPPPPAYPSDAPLLEQVRKMLREGISPEAAVIEANALPGRPERADAAFLLLEYAAESGNPDAALLVGRYYDPADDWPSGTIRKNPETAFDWYQAALVEGIADAPSQLGQLRSWVEKEADSGDAPARALLKRWP